MLLDPDKISKNRDNFRILVCVTEGSVSRNNFYYILSGHTTNRHFLTKTFRWTYIAASYFLQT